MRRFVLSLLVTMLACGHASGSVIFTQKSLYRNISVVDDGEHICLQFSTHRLRKSWQSCQFKRDPERLVFPYTRMVMSGLLLDPQPRRVLVAGLGGGTIPRTLHDLFPQAEIDIAEIDPAVVAVAARFFGFHEKPPVRIIVSDARVYVKRALAGGQHYDLIILDAFTGDYIPEHLMTREFLEECRRLLAQNGVLVANTFSSSKLYDSESVTYEKVLGWFLNLRQSAGNRIILTRKGAAVSPGELRRAASKSRFDLRRFGVDLGSIAALASDKPDWNQDAPILTDQYAPVNLLNGPH